MSREAAEQQEREGRLKEVDERNNRDAASKKHEVERAKLRAVREKANYMTKASNS